MKVFRSRSRLIAIALGIAALLLVIVAAPSTALLQQELSLLHQTFANRDGPQTQGQNSEGTILFEIEDALAPGDSALEDGSLYDSHAFSGEAGQIVAITLESIQFDTVLSLQDAAGNPIASNDDIDIEAYNYNSFIAVTLPVAETYHIRVSAYDNARLGNYRLIVVQTAAETASPNLSEAALTQVEANQRLELGIQANRAGQYTEAIQLWQDALGLYQTIGDRYGEANSLGNMGNAYHSLGRYLEAVELHQQALAIERDIGNQVGETDTLNNLGVVYYALGQYQPALELHQRVLDIVEEMGDRAPLPARMRQAEANALGNLGSVYYALGQYQRAIDAYQQALAITRDIEVRKAFPRQSRRVEASILGNLGSVYDVLGEYQRAIDLQQQFLATARELGDRPGEANALGNLGNAYHSLGEYEQAIDFHQQSLAIDRELGNRQGAAISLGNLGYVYSFLGQYQRSIDFYQQQVVIAREIRDRQGEAKALNNLGFMLIITEQFAEAETVLTQAIDVYESLRRDLSDAQLIAIADSQAHAYTNLEIALVFQQQPIKALAITERGRAQAFALQLASRRPNSPTEPLTEPSLVDIQRTAQQQNLTLVEYSLIYDQSLYIWVIQPSGDIQFRSVSLSDSGNDFAGDNPIARLDAPIYRGGSDPSALETLVTASRAGIGVVVGIPTEQLQTLRQILIDPIADLLPTDPEAKIVFIPQGSLFLVPFAALQDANGTHLIEQHTVLTAPSIQVLDLAASSEQRGAVLAGDNALVVGNPIMPEVWLPGEGGLQATQLAPLPGAEAEALAIGDFLDASPLIGNQATEAKIKQQLPTASLIHLATHGLLDYGNPQSSGVLDVPGAVALTPGDGEDGLLTAAEILEMDLQAELAVLSACDTGRGRITGDGVVGLSRALITAGVPSVIVSLWAVPDAPTAALMTEFYKQLQQGQTKVQALRQAMLATMTNHPEPINWAAFTLVGAAD